MNLKIRVENIGDRSDIDKNKIKKLITYLLTTEGVTKAEIGIILVDDAYITELNTKFLNRNHPTDVLSFPLSDPEDNTLEGEVYVSLERAEAQAKEYGVSFQNELYRLLIHGLLHLLGYNDTSPQSRLTMKAREDYYLTQGG